MNTPNGLEEIKDVFGDIFQYINGDGTLGTTWEAEKLALMYLPYSLSLAWAPATMVNRITVHKLLTPTFIEVFTQIQQRGLAAKVTQLGGAFSYRPERGSYKLSTHAWGIAIDLNPTTNQQGTSGDMDVEVIQIFESAGFFWGGNFEGARKDPMHFQFATGY